MSAPRVYTGADVRRLLKLSRSTFYALKKAGQIPCLEECRPRIGRRARFRADLVDRWMANQFTSPRSFRRAS